MAVFVSQEKSFISGFLAARLWSLYYTLAPLYYTRYHYKLLPHEDDAMDAARTDSESGASEKLPVTHGKWWMQWRTWPRKRLYIWLSASLACLALLGLAIGLGVHFGIHRSNSPVTGPVDITAGTGLSTSATVVKGPVVQSNFADPCYITENNIHYSFATNKYKQKQPGQVNIQMATSPDFHNWTLTGKDALPQVGNWSAGDFVWAPSVAKLDNGTYIMYYSAHKAGTKQQRLHCIGAAYSDNVEGPYVPMAETFVCPLDQGGAIDPSAFHDSDGKRYVVYKIDGNSLNHQGSSFHPTPLMLQEVAADGITPIGSPVQLLDRQSSDGPLIEAPAMGRYDQGNGAEPLYVLFYSSNVFTTPHYNVLYATSNSPQGPFVRGDNSLLRTGDGNGKLVGPGGMDVGDSSQQVVFHSIDTKDKQPGLTRTLWVGSITVKGSTVTL